ncbi:MAG: RNA methyltransferase [Rikenellaceae bacterium]|nr:RNA methyltransferase [Rikenellaceae bacterium]
MAKADIARVKNLARKEVRVREGLFVAEGMKLVSELIASSLTATVYALPEAAAKLPPCNVVQIVTAKEMERISHLKTPSDVLALVQIPAYPAAAPARDTLSLMLDGVQDPGNLGTIIRLADWFGIGDIFCSSATVDCFNPKVVQATMGAIVRVRVHYGDLAVWLDAACRDRLPVYGTFLEGKNVYTENLSTECVILLGSEGHGISPGAAARVTEKLVIPPYPADTQRGESLNVAIAAAIICAEFRRFPARVF